MQWNKAARGMQRNPERMRDWCGGRKRREKGRDDLVTGILGVMKRREKWSGVAERRMTEIVEFEFSEEPTQ